MRLTPKVYVHAAGAVHPLGMWWRGLSSLLDPRSTTPTTTTVLAQSHPDAAALQVPDWPSTSDPTDVKQHRMMSRPARLAAVALAQVMDAQLDRSRCGLFLGVGASAGSLTELTALLKASVVDGELNGERLGTQGLQACHPLFTFQLMNNFTLCHGAIALGLQGPNAAFFSRGEGTWCALEEAVYALEDGRCSDVIAGGADSALHAATWVELRNALHPSVPVPSEGAAMLRLSTSPKGALAHISLMQHPWEGTPDADVVVQTPGSIDALGQLQAAGPAMGWCVALDLIVQHGKRRVAVLSTGVHEETSLVVLERTSP